jgi:hypothetical protein
VVLSNSTISESGACSWRPRTKLRESAPATRQKGPNQLVNLLMPAPVQMSHSGRSRPYRADGLRSARHLITWPRLGSTGGPRSWRYAVVLEERLDSDDSQVWVSSHPVCQRREILQLPAPETSDVLDDRQPHGLM